MVEGRDNATAANRQAACCMIVVKEFAAEFQIEFAAELRDALSDVGGLQLDVFFVVESLAHKGRHPFPNDVVNGKIIPDIVGNKKMGFPRWRIPFVIESNYSHSIVAGGLEVQSRTTRLIWRHSLVMRVEIVASTS